ncbi:unnamed protein product [Ambrosiozyma monospora]|uniref:Unnamed protein product n=1 Tax=Ambrosiozyma monospora TaxID=43982 RepID=A0ACB5SWB5_AMBMO|nr:unnamed protein product [Ambrosiozyma monospora]
MTEIQEPTNLPKIQEVNYHKPYINALQYPTNARTVNEIIVVEQLPETHKHRRFYKRFNRYKYFGGFVHRGLGLRSRKVMPEETSWDSTEPMPTMKTFVFRYDPNLPQEQELEPESVTSSKMSISNTDFGSLWDGHFSCSSCSDPNCECRSNNLSCHDSCFLCQHDDGEDDHDQVMSVIGAYEGTAISTAKFPAVFDISLFPQTPLFAKFSDYQVKLDQALVGSRSAGSSQTKATLNTGSIIDLNSDFSFKTATKTDDSEAEANVDSNSAKTITLSSNESKNIEYLKAAVIFNSSTNSNDTTTTTTNNNKPKIVELSRNSQTATPKTEINNNINSRNSNVHHNTLRKAKQTTPMITARPSNIPKVGNSNKVMDLIAIFEQQDGIN